MNGIYLLTGLLTVIGAAGGLVLLCYLERRSFASKRRRLPKIEATHAGEPG